MNKRFLLIPLALATAALAFAAGSNQAPQTQSAGPAPITLTGYMQIDPADPQYAYWPPTLEAFAAKYPNIKLDFEYVTGEQFHDKFQSMAMAQQIPDLFTCYAGARSSYLLDRGAVKDLRPRLTDEFKSHYNQAIWEPQGPNGEIYIISPNMAVCTVLYVNPKVLKDLGIPQAKSLDELAAQVPAITAAGLTPMMFGNSAVWPGSSVLLSGVIDRTGGKAWFDKARSGAARFSDKPFVDALAVVKNLMDAKIMPAGVNQISGGDAIRTFASGKAPYLLQTGWIFTTLKDSASPEDYAQYEVAAFPAVAGEVTHGSSAATLGEALAMNAKLSGAKEDAAWNFLSFVYGKEGLDYQVKAGNVVTYNFDLSGYDIDPLVKKFIALTNTQTMGYVIDAVMDGEGVNNILNPGIQAVMIGDKTPEQVAAEYETWVAANDSNRKK